MFTLKEVETLERSSLGDYEMWTNNRSSTFHSLPYSSLCIAMLPRPGREGLVHHGTP